MKGEIYPLIIVSILVCFVLFSVITFRRSVAKRQKEMKEERERKEKESKE